MMQFCHGDRVRIKNPLSEYTGCRGTIMLDAADQPDGVHALGHFVAMDGENGRTRPFLVSELEPLQAARVAGRAERMGPRRQVSGEGPDGRLGGPADSKVD